MGDNGMAEAGVREDIGRLKAHLLEFGGKRFQFDWYLNVELSERDVIMLLSCGVLQDGGGAELLEMAQRECHSNAATLVTLDPKLTFVTGLALSDDGIWRIHSWAVSPMGNIIETTEPRVKYFGYHSDGGHDPAACVEQVAAALDGEERLPFDEPLEGERE